MPNTKLLKLRSVNLGLILSLGVSILAAQNSTNLNLKKVRDLALKNNPQVKLARKEVYKSSQKVDESRGNLLPTVSGFSNYQRAWELPTIFFDNPGGAGQISFKMGSENTVTAGLNLQQPIFLGGAAWNGYQMSKLGNKLAQNQEQTTRQSVLFDATGAYYGVLFTRSAVEVMETALETARENLKQVQEFRAAGKSSDFDVLQAEVQAASYQPQVISARNNARLAESRLRTVIGLDPSVELVINDKLTYEPSDLTKQDIDNIFNLALTNRPEVRSIKLQKSMAQRQLSLARAAYSPALIFQTAYQYQGQRNDLNFTGDDFNKSFNSSLSLSIPIFNGLQTSAKVQQAKIGLHEVDDQREALVRGIRMEVEGAYFTMQEAEEKVTAQIKLVEQAREAFRLAKLRYQEGASTQLEVMNSELVLSQAQMTHQQSLYEYNLALAGLQKALNQL